MGVRIVPPMISFYQNYTTIEEWNNNLWSAYWKWLD